MKRVSKTIYSSDEGRDLISLSNGKASLERAYYSYSADELDELGSACKAAAEELRETADKEQPEAATV